MYFLMTSEISAGAGSEAVKAQLVLAIFMPKIMRAGESSQMVHKNFLII
ncbi:MAG: hypothetical protein WAK57_16060 [Desulfobacterales bacterium]